MRQRLRIGALSSTPILATVNVTTVQLVKDTVHQLRDCCLNGMTSASSPSCIWHTLNFGHSYYVI